MPRIALTGHLKCSDAAQVQKVREHLPLHLEFTRNEPGCLLFEVRPTGDPLLWRVDEVFADAEAFAAHQARAAASDWARATAKITREYKTTELPADALGRPRAPSPLGGARPSRDELARIDASYADAIDDILPASATPLRLLIVGINPGLWTAAVNAPFARPGNRFWPSLSQAGLTDRLVDASAGLRSDDEAQLLSRGIGLTNLVGRATARADELAPAELRDGARRLIGRLELLQPDVVAIAGVTAYRTAFAEPRAKLGRQDQTRIAGWPEAVNLWVVPQPSGLNAHHQIESLAQFWRQVWADTGN